MKLLASSKHIWKSVSLRNDTDQQVIQDTVNNLVYTMNRKVQSLGDKDKRRVLYVRSENKGKDTVVFPDVFPGQLGDNVYRFMKEFKEVILESQVKKADEVKTLQKYLGVEAKSKCGDHYPDLDSALHALTEYYGNATLIWAKTKDEFQASFANSTQTCGEYGDPARVSAIARVIEFLCQCNHLAT